MEESDELKEEGITFFHFLINGRCYCFQNQERRGREGRERNFQFQNDRKVTFWPSFFYDLGYKNRCAWSNFSSQACSHTHWAGQERENGFVGGPLNSHAFIPGTRESFPHFTLLELTEKKEWKSRRVTVFETIQKVFGYIFDCSYYHKASSFFSQLGKYTYFIAT